MLSEICIKEKLTIDCPEEAVRSINYSNGTAITVDDLQESIGPDPKLYYFDRHLSQVDQDDPSGVYCWIATGITRDTNEEIYISTLRRDEGYYAGHFTETAFKLGNKAWNYFAKTTREKQEMKNNFAKTFGCIGPVYKEGMTPSVEAISTSRTHRNKSAEQKRCEYRTGVASFDYIDSKAFTSMDKDTQQVLNDVHGLLMIDNWRTTDGLLRYIQIIGFRIKTLIEGAETNYYAINKIGSVIVNTGLLDRYGQDILIMYRHFAKDDIYKPHSVVASKRDFLDNNFTLEDSVKNICPINFFKTGESEVFSAKIEEFDINLHSLSHILSERRDRFPASADGLSDSILADRIKNSIEVGLKLQERDHSYIKAIFTTGTNDISWIFPFHISGDISQRPEMALVVRKIDRFYEVKTIFAYNNALLDKIRCLALYS